MHRKTTENAVFTRNFEFIDPLRSFDRNMVFNYTNLTIRKGLYNKYMILLFDDADSKTGKLVFCGDVQNKEYDSWFMQPKPITPIYNDKDELEDMAVYDE